MDQDELCVRLVYAPLPEESSSSSAALDFATRAARLLPGVGVLEDPSLLPDHIEELKLETEEKKTVWLFVISCAADGSVHRNVRKFMRSLKEHENADSKYYALALLGHARCDNSSKQMNGTIYGIGRRMDKALAGVFSKTLNRCETQAELEGPETLFDPWVQTLLTPKTAL